MKNFSQFFPLDTFCVLVEGEQLIPVIRILFLSRLQLRCIGGECIQYTDNLFLYVRVRYRDFKILYILDVYMRNSCTIFRCKYFILHIYQQVI